MKAIAEIIYEMSMYGLEKLGLYYSQYRGWVVDNQDPLNLQRLKINVPEVYGDGVPNYWAWPVANFSGNFYGSQCIPQKGDFIWVSFEKGNIRKPIWNHGYFSKGKVPDDLTNTKLYWFRTPSGLTILIDDINGTISLYKKDGELQPMVLGETLDEKMGALIDILKAAKIMTDLGPQGFMTPFQEQLTEFKENFKAVKSAVNKLS